MFITREYDSRKFSNDRDVIQRLPAFHVHINKAYNRTFYPNTRPLDHINECIELYIRLFFQSNSLNLSIILLFNSIFISFKIISDDTCFFIECKLVR